MSDERDESAFSGDSSSLFPGVGADDPLKRETARAAGDALIGLLDTLRPVAQQGPTVLDFEGGDPEIGVWGVGGLPATYFRALRDADGDAHYMQSPTITPSKAGITFAGLQAIPPATGFLTLFFSAREPSVGGSNGLILGFATNINDNDGSSQFITINVGGSNQGAPSSDPPYRFGNTYGLIKIRFNSTQMASLRAANGPQGPGSFVLFQTNVIDNVSVINTTYAHLRWNRFFTA